VAKLVDRIKAGEIGAPVSELIGFRLTSVEPGKAVFELDAGPQHANPMGTLHGGVLELKINFLRPFRTGKLIATARMVKAGRTIGLAECDVTDAEGRLIARAMSTCMTLRGDPVKVAEPLRP
jgi:acyl-coenzyme A thioesterase PaaI-like protein